MRKFLCLLSSLPALAQQNSPQDPLDAAIQAVRTADNAHFQEAIAARDEARALLNLTPVTSPRFVSWANKWQVFTKTAVWAPRPGGRLPFDARRD